LNIIVITVTISGGVKESV